MNKLKLFFLLFLISSCNLKPRYERPEMNLSEEWRFAPDDAEEMVNLSWWEQFNDTTLNQLIQKAIENNHDLQAATARVLEYYARYRIVFAKFFPELNLDANFDRLKLPQGALFFPSVPGIPRLTDIYDLFFTLSYELDFWGRIRNASEAARAEYMGQIDSRRTIILSLVSSVATAYIQLKQFDHQLRIVKLTYTSRLDSWDIATKRFDAGLTSEMEVKQAESEARVAEFQVKNMEIFIAEQENLISILTGDPPGPIERGVLLSELHLPPSVPADLPCNLLENRPDILQAEQKIIAANAQIGVAKAALFPTFSLTGAQGQISTTLHHFFADSATFFDYGIRTFLNLFAGGRILNEIKREEAMKLEAIHTYQQTILNALNEVENALISHEKAREKLEIQNAHVAALEEYLRLAKLRYDNGQNDYLTVLDAEKSLFQVQLDQISVEAEVFLSLIHLYKALGHGWQVEQAEAQ